MYSTPKAMPLRGPQRTRSRSRDTKAIRGNEAVHHCSSQLTDWLFFERYVSIVWTRRRVRDEQTKVKLALRLLVSSSKRGVQSTDTASSISIAVCRRSVVESNPNFQSPRFESCAGPLIIESQIHTRTITQSSVSVRRSK